MKEGEKLKVIFAWLAKAQLEKIVEGEDSDKVDDETEEEEAVELGGRRRWTGERAQRC